MRCDECKWWKPAFEKASYGECHWDLPKVITRDGVSTAWPAVYNDDFCGEFDPSEGEDSDG